MSPTTTGVRIRPASERGRPDVSRLGLIALAAALLLGCSGGSSEGGGSLTTLERAQDEGVVRVGYANEAPYAYLDSDSDSLLGEAPAVARLVLGELGITEMEGVLAEFGALIPGLKAGRFDVIAAGMYVQPRRCGEVAFSEPSYCIGEAFMVQAGNPKGLHSYDDVASHPSATVGVVAGAVELGYARELGVPDERIVIFPDAPSAVAGVQSGRVDAYAGTRLTVLDLLSKAGDADLAVAEPFEQPLIDGEPVLGCGAFAFRPEDQAFVDAFNVELARLLGGDEHLAAVAPFGFGPEELPGDVTTTELCRGP